MLSCSHVSNCSCFLLPIFARVRVLEPMQHTDGNKCDELYQRISYLERELESAQKEAYELREQNELLEFRNIELEESFEKVRIPCVGCVAHSIPCSRASIQFPVSEHTKRLSNEPTRILVSSQYFITHTEQAATEHR